MPSRFPVMRYLLAATAIVSGLVFVLGDPSKWQRTPSLQLLNQSPIPIDCWGVLAVVYGCFLLADRTRTAGYALGTVLYATVSISLIITLGGPGPKNIFAVEAAVIATMYHALAIRFSALDRYLR